MLRPKLASPQVGGVHLGIPAGDYLYLDGRTIASPALRVLAWFDSDVADEVLDRGLTEVLDLFLARFGRDLRSLTRSRNGRVPKAEIVTPDLLAAARDSLVGRKPGKKRSMRMGGWIEAPHFIEAAPYLRLDSAAGLVMLELALPHEASDLIEIADHLTRIFATMPLRCGVMGLGFFMPVYLESLIFALPMTTRHLLAAIEITLDGPVPAIRPHDPHGRKAAGRDGMIHDDAEPGAGQHSDGVPVLADIGWRTLLGAPLMMHLPDLSLLEETAEITVQRHPDMVAITAGPCPIWGSTTMGEEITAYIKVAQALRPLRMSRRAAENGLFGGNDDDPVRFERICAYLGRFDL